MEKSVFNSTLGSEIKKLREQKKLTQSELGALMNINAQNISSYERGERCPSMYWMHRLFLALELNPNNFIENFYKELQKRHNES